MKTNETDKILNDSADGSVGLSTSSSDRETARPASGLEVNKASNIEQAKNGTRLGLPTLVTDEELAAVRRLREEAGAKTPAPVGDIEGEDEELEESVEGQGVRLQFLDGGGVKVVVEAQEDEPDQVVEGLEAEDQGHAVEGEEATSPGLQTSGVEGHDHDRDQAHAVKDMEVKESGAGSGLEVVAGVEARAITTAKPVKGQDLAEAVPTDKQVPVLGGSGKEKPTKADGDGDLPASCQISVDNHPERGEANVRFGCNCRRRDLVEFLKLLRRVASQSEVDFVDEAGEPAAKPKKPARGMRIEIKEGAGHRKGFGRIW